MFKFYMAFFAGKLTAFACLIMKNFVHRAGSNLPGKVALKIDPEFLSNISRPNIIIAVTGTNGKTTTTNMIADILLKCGNRVITNRLGSNINTGIATCLLNGSTLSNKPKADIAVLEVDERSSLRIYPYVHPNYLLVTNLSRDSLKRNAHPFFNRDLIQKSLPDDCMLILNSDDLIASSIKQENNRIYYGIDQQVDDVNECMNLINDLRACPRCGAMMKIDFCRYNHIGRMHCPQCGLSSPTADVSVKTIDYIHRKLIFVSGEEYPLINDSMFNIYNEVAAIALLRTFGIAENHISNALDSIQIADSRYNEAVVKGIHIIRQMTKGQIATACSSALKYISSIPGRKEILLNIEDSREQKLGSENTAYLYETDFEFLNRPEIEKIIISGHSLKEDISLRLQLAGIPKDNIYIGLNNPTDDISLFDLDPAITLIIVHDNYQIHSGILAEQYLIKRINEN
jgi:UDP-N-acetylmuramoylalanine-D-glutamate ligase